MASPFLVVSKITGKYSNDFLYLRLEKFQEFFYAQARLFDYCP
jgi:hypothetical protein